MIKKRIFEVLNVFVNNDAYEGFKIHCSFMDYTEMDWGIASHHCIIKNVNNNIVHLEETDDFESGLLVEDFLNLFNHLDDEANILFELKFGEKTFKVDFDTDIIADIGCSDQVIILDLIVV